MYNCIINPNAGRGDGRKLGADVEKFLKGHGHEVVLHICTENHEASSAAKKASAAGSQGIIGVGGDGTVQAIAAGILEDRDKCNTPLGIISCGSGNDWKRSFPGAEDCLNALLTGSTKTIDAIRANGMACLNIANVGIDAKIVRTALPLKKTLGKYAYVIASLVNINRRMNTRLTIEIAGGERLQGDFTLVAVCNGQYYGGNMHIAPSAVMDDGQITLCIVKGLRPSRAFVLLPKMLVGRHTGDRAVRFLECEGVRLISDRPQVLCLDGNLYEAPEVIDFRILPGAVRVFAGG